MVTRRSFMVGAAGILGGAVVPAGLGWMVGVDPRSVLLLTDSSNALSRSVNTLFSVVHHPLTLDIAADSTYFESAELEAEHCSVLVALGTPVSVFVLGTQLGDRWRVVMRGMHCANGPNVHQFNARTAMAPSVSKALAHARNEDDFTRDLISLGGESIDLPNQEMVSRLHHAWQWAESPRASLLALRRRVA